MALSEGVIERHIEAAWNAPLPAYVCPTVEQREVERAIPRRIIQSWVDKVLTRGVAELCDTHQRCNPGYKYVFYTDAQCRRFIETHFPEKVIHAYDALIAGAHKADLFRYCELYVNGGWWFDLDTLSVGSIDALVPSTVEFACPRDCGVYDRPALYQAILGASKGNLVLKNAIDRVVAQLARPPPPTDWVANLAISGPVLLGETACSTLEMRLDDGTNKGWVDSDTACFGDSIKSNGRCTLGNGVIAIAHSTGAAYICPASRRIRPILSRTQAGIENRMIELKTHYKNRHCEYKDFNDTKKPIYTYPNSLSPKACS